MIIAVTGHRPPKCGIDYNLKTKICSSIKERFIDILQDKKPIKAISGMALGIDTLWALTCLELNFPLIAAIPCIAQEKIWPQKSQDIYNSILSNSLTEKHLCYNGTYNNRCMQQRNIWMAQNSDLVVAVWDGSQGGTGNMVKYCKSIDRQIIQINPAELF